MLLPDSPSVERLLRSPSSRKRGTEPVALHEISNRSRKLRQLNIHTAKSLSILGARNNRMALRPRCLPGLAARLAALLLVISIGSTPGLFLGAAAQNVTNQEIDATDLQSPTVQPVEPIPVGTDYSDTQVDDELVDEADDDDEDTNSQSISGLSLSGSLMKFIHHVTSLHVDDLFESKDEEEDEEDEPADVFDGTEEEFEELISPQDDNEGSTNSTSSQQPPPADSATTGSEGEECPAILPLPGCKPKQLPKCLPLGAFNQKWFSLSKKNWPAFLASAWGKSMRANPKQAQMIEASLPPHDFLGDSTKPLPTCAVVGSSYSILGSKLGPIIDKFDVVVRVNAAIVGPYKRDAGSFTTMRYTNFENENFREQHTESMVANWCGASGGKPSCKVQDLVRITSRKLHPFNPAFTLWTKNPYFKKFGHVPTSGFVSAMLLAHICKEVTLVHFGLSNINGQAKADKLKAAGKNYNLKRWYYTPNKGTVPPKNWNLWKALKKTKVPDYSYIRAPDGVQLPLAQHGGQGTPIASHRRSMAETETINSTRDVDNQAAAGTNETAAYDLWAADVLRETEMSEAPMDRAFAAVRRFLASKKKPSSKKSASKKKKKKKSGGIQSAGIMLEKGCMKALADQGVFKIMGP